MKVIRDLPRILVIDEEPRLCRSLESSLISRGFTVRHIEDLQGLSPGSLSKHFDLVIHACHGHQNHDTWCDQILAANPFLPSLHLKVGEDFGTHALPKGSLHMTMRHLAPQRELLRKIQILHFQGKLLREREHLKRSLNLREKLDAFMGVADHHVFMEHVLKFLGWESRARNAIWVPQGMNSDFQEVSKIEEIPRHLVWRPSPAPQQEIQQVWPGDLNQVNEALYLKDPNESTQMNVILPVKGFEGMLGHIVVLGVVEWSEEDFREVWHLLEAPIGKSSQVTRILMDTRNQTYRDDLTHLYNQRFLYRALEVEIQRSRRSGEPFSLLFLDVDHLKHINDMNGHLAGSRILKDIGSLLTTQIRGTDYAFRYGGDEFIVILVGTNTPDAQKVAERIRGAVEAKDFHCEGLKIRTTVSVGVATFPTHGQNRDDIIRIADQAMYDGKKRYRNIVFIAS